MENPNVPSLRQQWTGLTKQVKFAFEQPRINRLSDAELPELKKLLLQLFTLTGLRNDNFPDKIQTDLLINFIREDLGNFSIEEILLAFRMAIKNELEIEANHYQAFSAHYIAQIMSAYTKIRSSHLKLIRANENALKIESKMTHTPEELQEIKKGYILESLIKPFRYYLKSGKLTFGITPFSIIYKTMTEDLGLLNLSGDEKKVVYDQATKEIEEHLNSPINSLEEHNKRKSIRHDIEKKGFAKAMEHELKIRCYEITIRNYFKHCYDNKIDFEQIVSDKLKLKFDK